MKTFTDNAGRTWTIQVNVDAIRRVRDLLKVNLLEVVEGKLLEQLISDHTSTLSAMLTSVGWHGLRTPLSANEGIEHKLENFLAPRADQIGPLVWRSPLRRVLFRGR
mgnify:CR=1 FL=1|jgi:hypothetical protein